jgi:hypothetical protein
MPWLRGPVACYRQYPTQCDADKSVASLNRNGQDRISHRIAVQNGWAIAMMTMTIISTVGTSLANR